MTRKAKIGMTKDVVDMNGAKCFRRVAALGVLVGLVSLAGPAGLAAQTQIGIEVGAEPAPLALDVIAGADETAAEAVDRIDLSDAFGERPVVLQFWATWCPKCEALEPRMIEAHREFGDRVDFYAVAVAVGQNPRRIARHLEDHPLPFPMLWDEDGEATRRFQAPTTSYVVILDADGRVAYTGVDSDQDIRGAVSRIVGKAPSGS
jgi:thiol-disulfide isomerase/thioredoxin